MEIDTALPMEIDTAYRLRLVEPLLEELSRELSELVVVGPRAVGKTTTATRHSATVVRLDLPGFSESFCIPGRGCISSASG